MKADKDKTAMLLKTAKGQIEGILKMIEDDRYCIDISNQLIAVSAILQKANKEVLKAHMQCCIDDVVSTQDNKQKIEELNNIIDKIIK